MIDLTVDAAKGNYQNIVNLHWYDQAGNKQEVALHVKIDDREKPQTFSLYINKHRVYCHPSGEAGCYTIGEDQEWVLSALGGRVWKVLKCKICGHEDIHRCR